MSAAKKRRRAAAKPAAEKSAPDQATPEQPRAAAPERADRTGGFPWWAFALAAIALALVAYAPALSGPFILDDYDLLEPASAVRTGDPLSIVRSGRPLLMLSYIANERLAGGFEPFGFHLVNVVLHGLNALILWLWLRALLARATVSDRTRRQAGLFVWGVPLLFLLSPIQTESVAYISSRSEALAGTFYLLGLWAFTVWRDRNPWVTAALVTVCFVGAASSKQDKLTLPFAVLLMDYLLLSGCNWRGLKKSLPTYGLFGVGIVAGFFVLVRPFLFSKTAGFRLDWQPYLFTELRMYFRYLRQLIWPTGLNIDPDIAVSQSLGDHFSWLALLALLAIAGALVWFRREAPLAVFGAALFFLILGPTTSFFPLADYAAERRLYLPAIGFFVVLLWGLSRLFEAHSKTPFAIVGLLAAIYLGGTWQRSQVWASEMAIWQDAALKSPEKARPWTWIGRIHNERGEVLRARQAWERAAELVEEGTEEQAFLFSNLGLAAAQAGEYEKAVDYYIRGLKTYRAAPQIWAQLAVAQMRLGRDEQGWWAFEQAMKYKGRLGPEVFMLRAQEYFQAGEYAKAAQDYRSALAYNPDNEEAQRNLAIAEAAAERAGQ